MVIWKTTKILLGSTDILLEIFLAFFIWERQKNLEIIILFGIIYFAAVPLGTFIAGLLSDYFSARVSALIGIWINITQIFVLLTIADTTLTNTIIYTVALLGGLANGLKEVPVLSVDFIKKGKPDETKFFANKNLVRRSVNLVIPLMAAYLITVTGGYKILFIIGIIAFIIISILIMFSGAGTRKNQYRLMQVLRIPGTNPDKPILIKAVFIESLSEGINITIVPIIVLSFAQSILNWGLLSTGVAIIALFISLWLNHIASDLNSKNIFAAGALLFALVSISFIAEFNLYLIIAHLIARSIMELIKDISFNSSIERIMEEDRKEYELYSEYQFLVQTVATFGRILPLVILLFLQIDIDNDLVIRATLLVIGLMPLLALSALGKSVIFDPDYSKKNTLTRVNWQKLPTMTSVPEEPQENSETPPLNGVSNTNPPQNT